MSFHLLLNKQGYIVKKDCVDSQTIKDIKKDLTVKPMVLKAYQDFVKPNAFTIYQESPNYLYLPRYYGIEKFGLPISNSLPQGQSIDIQITHDVLPHQKIAYQKSLDWFKEKGGGVLCLPCGYGKCMGIDTPILMHDGSIKKVQDVNVGDLLMGDDSTPRTVLSLARGQEEMFEIQPKKGDKWTCNRSHILSLKCSNNWSKLMTKGSIHDICLNDFLKLPKSFHGRGTPLRLYKVGIQFPYKPIPLDPYMLGYWLGDGYSNISKIVSENKEVIDYFRYNLLIKYNLNLRQDNTTQHHKGYLNYRITTGKYNLKTKTWANNDNSKNHFDICRKKYNLMKNKHIPLDYKCNSRDIQLKILAGLIDSDGYLDGNCYYFTLKDEQLLDDIVYLSRSLGFAAYKSTVQKTCTNSASTQAIRQNPEDRFGRVTGTYYSCCIFGNDLDQIPVLLNYKKAQQRKQIKDPLVNGFTVKSIGIGDYYGFVIDGNHRFLLGDYTVTHNTFLGIKLSADLGGKTLIVVNKECLMDQWIEAIEKFTGGKARIGIIQQSKIDVKDKDYVVAMLHSLAKKEYTKETFAEFRLAICDEAHHIGSEMFSKALPKIASKYMLGLSATPKRKDGLSKVFYSYLGELFHSEKRKGSNRVMVKRFKLTSPTTYYETLYMSNGIKNTAAMVTNLSRYEARSQLIVECIRALMKEDRKILLLSGRREHLEQIFSLLEKSDIKNIHGKKITFGYYRGNQGMNKNDHKKMLAESAKCDIVLGTYAIAAEGLDIPDLNTEIYATPSAEIEQALGRILRKFHEKINPLVVDLIDSCGNFPKQAYTRAQFYKDEDYEIQDIKIPLGHQVKELEPFISEISNYLLQTDFQQSKFPSKYKSIDDQDDDPDRPQSLHIGQCLLDETNNDPKLPFIVTLKKKPIKVENDISCDPILITPPPQLEMPKIIISAPPITTQKIQLKNNQSQNQKIQIKNQPEKLDIKNQPEKLEIKNQPTKIPLIPKKQEAVKVHRIRKNQKNLVFESKVNRYTKMSIGQCLLNDN